MRQYVAYAKWITWLIVGALNNEERACINTSQSITREHAAEIANKIHANEDWFRLYNMSRF